MTKLSTLVGKDVVWVRRLVAGDDGRVTPQWSQITMIHWNEDGENLSYVVEEGRVVAGAFQKDFPHNFLPRHSTTSRNISSHENRESDWLPGRPDRGKIYPIFLWGKTDGYHNIINAFPALEFAANPESCWTGSAGEAAYMYCHRIRRLHDLYEPIKVVGESLGHDDLILDTIRLKGVENLSQSTLTALWWASTPGGLACEILKPYAQRDEVLRNAWEGLDWASFSGINVLITQLFSHPNYQFGEFMLEMKHDRFTAYSSVTAYNHPVRSSHDIFSLYMDHFAVTALKMRLDLQICL